MLCLVNELLHLLLKRLGRRVDRVLDVAADEVVVSDIDDNVVAIGLLVALDKRRELLPVCAQRFSVGHFKLV